MKALFHWSAGCAAIRSPKADGSWTFCDCGQAAIRWTNPAKGMAEVWAADPTSARIIGFDNAMLIGDPQGATDEQWREWHRKSIEQVPDRYLFHQDKRACWAVVFRPGDTGDVKRVVEKPEGDA